MLVARHVSLNRTQNQIFQDKILQVIPRNSVTCNNISKRKTLVVMDFGNMENALGCLIGVAVGDAAGAPLEAVGFRSTLEKTVIEQAMHMIGQTGRLDLGRGQITDDTELTICLARGLSEASPSAGFPSEAVARQYCYWHQMGAFGGGQTCIKAFSVSTHTSQIAESVSKAMKDQAQTVSMGSKANGALMRITPLAVWGHKLRPERIAQYAIADASLSHPNPTCGQCSAVYCIAAAHLIAHPGDAAGALQAACDWANAHADEDVKQWILRDTCQPIELLDCLEHPGFVRHAFTLAFHHFRRQTEFEDALRQTLCKGGDTDTNAAIVGGLMGAFHGLACIPEWMVKPVVEYEGREDQGGGIPRPAELRAARLLRLAEELYQAAGS